MGSRFVKYEFSPKENEQIEAVIKVPEETRSVIHGVVIDCRNKPIKNAVVKLLEVIPGNPSRLKPLTHTFTDECGQFLFGPLYCNKKYALKVWYSDVKIRELIITPDCDSRCDDDLCDYHSEDHSDDSSDDQYDDRDSEDYCDGHYDGHCDIDLGDYFEVQDDAQNNDYNDDEHSGDYGHHIIIKDDNHKERKREDNNRNKRYEEKRRDRHSDDDNYIHYKEPKVYGQKCSKCEMTKNRNNSFEDIEK